ncbi:MAG: His/Gly/Thr/Pro-type tRNA ligase C-terminal domain-containing protein, partial [Actinomycetota bacterium]|nr:His/Gly/Thr/Pro-type tRNA ligase C-terminal domain-containing protein [Actinomycetota bacterium]
TLADAGMRVEVDDSVNSMQRKIRENAKQKIPYLLIVGDDEIGEGTVNVRKRGEKRQEALKVEEFLGRATEEIASRGLNGQE